MAEEQLPLYRKVACRFDLVQDSQYTPAFPIPGDIPPPYKYVDKAASRNPAALEQPVWLDKSTDSLRFCKSCSEARQSTSYISRLAKLFRPLYCPACDSLHPSMFFSRKNENRCCNSRECIAYEAECSICPHMGLKLRHIEYGLHPSDSVHWICDEPDCVCIKAQASLAPCGDNPYDFAFSSSWSRTTQLDYSTPNLFQDFLMRPFANWLCPHHQLDPSNLFNASKYEEWEDHGDSNKKDRIFQRLKCTACKAYSYLETATKPGCDILEEFTCNGPLKMAKFGHVQSCALKINEDTCQSEWYRIINPKSYGLMKDGKWKHIVWCGDLTCATSHKMARFDALRDLGNTVASSATKPKFHRIAQQFDDLTRQFLERLS